MSYYVVMIDYGRRGREAVVDPENTRRDVIAKVRDVLAKGDGTDITFVHKITKCEGLVEDVTDDILAQAMDIDLTDVLNLDEDRQAAAFDHARDLRKHGVV